MVLQPIVRTIPGISTICTLDKSVARIHEAVSGRRVEPVRSEPMHNQRMCIEGATGDAVLPCLPAIHTSHECPCLDSGEEATGREWIRRNPADVAGIWSWRKSPARSRREMAQSWLLPPCLASIL